MSTRERFSRKQLKQPDEFISTSERMIEYCSQNRGTLVAIALVILVVVGGSRFVVYNRQSNELRMENLLDAMKKVKGPTSRENSELAPEKLKEYLDQFKEGPHKQRANLLLADAYYQNRQFKEAIELYGEILQGYQTGDLNYQLAQMGLGYSLENEKEYEKAREIYKSIIDQEGSLPLVNVYLSLARVYELEDDYKSALEILRQIPNKFQGHALLDKVQGKIEKLEGQV